MIIKPSDIAPLYNRYGSLKAIARETKVSYRKVQSVYVKALELGMMEPLAQGRKPNSALKLAVPKQRVTRLKTHTATYKRYILTCAQNNTDVHRKTWTNLLALAEHYSAKLMVSTFLYARRSHWQANLDKSERAPTSAIWWHPLVVPFINNDRVEIAPGLVWCGELNILPTAERPLSGLEVYTGRKSMIVPHTHLQMQSIATVGGSGAKLNFTTGAVTLRNYIQRKEGFKAEFHHVYGALLVEVDDEGHWWVRQLCADSDGVIYDLDLKVADGKITTGHRVEALTFGDIHVEEMDKAVKEGTWGPDGLVDVLRPRFQFMHDVLDFRARSYHRENDPYAVYRRFVEKRESVRAEICNARDFLVWAKRKDCDTIIVPSNHDRFLGGWLTYKDGRKDPINAEFWSELNLASLRYINEHKDYPDHFKLAMSLVDPKFNAATFLPLDQSFVILPEIGGGIEASMHGDMGRNGSRGSLRQFATMGRRSNVGHSHVAGIDGGAYQGGTKSSLRLEYNHGPSAWSHTDIVTYENSKRSLITFFGGKWRA